MEYVTVTDNDAVSAFKLTTRLEGIIPALEPSHAIAHVVKIAGQLPTDHVMIINMSGRGDKDLDVVTGYLRNH